MNADQIGSLVRSVLKVLGTWLAAHGASKAGSAINAEDTIGVIMTLIGFIMSHSIHSDSPPATKPPSGAVTSVLLLGLCLALGCSSQNARLEQGGSYAPATFLTDTNGAQVTLPTQAPDIGFYQVDSAFNLAYGTVQGAFKFERDNRAMLWKVSPKIKKALDPFRPQVWDAVVRYTKARAAYMAMPTPADLGGLQAILSEVQALTSAVVAALPATVK